MRIFEALLAILFIPAILYLVGVLRDYIEETIELNPMQAVFISASPFIVLGFYIIGLFLLIKGKDREEG